MSEQVKPRAIFRHHDAKEVRSWTLVLKPDGRHYWTKGGLLSLSSTTNYPLRQWFSHWDGYEKDTIEILDATPEERAEIMLGLLGVYE